MPVQEDKSAYHRQHGFLEFHLTEDQWRQLFEGIEEIPTYDPDASFWAVSSYPTEEGKFNVKDILNASGDRVGYVLTGITPISG